MLLNQFLLLSAHCYFYRFFVFLSIVHLSSPLEEFHRFLNSPTLKTTTAPSPPSSSSFVHSWVLSFSSTPVIAIDYCGTRTSNAHSPHSMANAKLIIPFMLHYMSASWSVKGLSVASYLLFSPCPSGFRFRRAPWFVLEVQGPFFCRHCGGVPWLTFPFSLQVWGTASLIIWFGSYLISVWAGLAPSL